ncbi:MAG TPA: SpoIIE family protein phosphatase [Candidatus Polarisedimenticolaceae bacterium]|nr:SpoIIE family protein phosphatase [Candidatus Polarisedimenticolaceae bacterium]
METLSGARVDWAVGATPHPGEHVIGDAYLVHEFPGGTLLAVVDGVGHGVEAESVARIAISTLAANVSSSVAALITQCHARLRGTRGATMTVASFDLSRKELSWAGVGDVAATLMRLDPAGRCREVNLLVRGGLIGTVLPTLQIQITPVVEGDVVILATDGVRPGFRAAYHPGRDPRDIAHRIIDEFGRGNDDALVLVGRFCGGAVTS